MKIRKEIRHCWKLHSWLLTTVLIYTVLPSCCIPWGPRRTIFWPPMLTYPSPISMIRIHIVAVSCHMVNYSVGINTYFIFTTSIYHIF